MRQVKRNSEGAIDSIAISQNIYLSKKDFNVFMSHKINTKELESFLCEDDLSEMLVLIANGDQDVNELKYDILKHNKLIDRYEPKKIFCSDIKGDEIKVGDKVIVLDIDDLEFVENTLQLGDIIIVNNLIDPISNLINFGVYGDFYGHRVRKLNIETRIYGIDPYKIYDGVELVSLQDGTLTDEQFVEIAEIQGNIWSSTKSFLEDYNNDNVGSALYIRDVTLYK